TRIENNEACAVRRAGILAIAGGSSLRGPSGRHSASSTRMRPELFRLFDVGFPSYFVLLLSGFMFATGLGVLWARRIGLNPDVIVDLGLAMLLSGVVGSRILHVLADGHFMEYV